MTNPNPVETLKAQVHGEASEHNAINCLLNCYIREYAAANGEVAFGAELREAPTILAPAVRRGELLVCIRLTAIGCQLLIAADRVSCLGRCRFLGKPFLQTRGQGWQAVGAETLCRLLLQNLSRVLSVNFDDELVEQVKNSIETTRLFLCGQKASQRPEDDFIRSEQRLLWGHAMHPSPKSRQGVSAEALLACSPELSAQFQLYWFEVDPQLIECSGEAAGHYPPSLTGLHRRQGYLYPCHPWEAPRLLGHPLLEAAMARQLIKPLGTLGEALSPTSSVRTLYHPELPQQLKFSIHVRLTNCIRKNAWYELESAVFLSGILKPLRRATQATLPGFHLMLEPLATTLDFSRLARAEKLPGAEQCREAFGILYRENFTPEQISRYSPTLAASLFTWNEGGESIAYQRIRENRLNSGKSYGEEAAAWFSDYVAALLPGTLYYLFKFGVVFEPHLQNTLIGFRGGRPCCVWIRDLEGTKLLPEHWPEQQLSALSPRARGAVYYDRQQGWKRIAYCLLVNNFSEAIFHLATGDRQLEEHLWQRLGHAIRRWQLRHGAEPELQELLAGAGLPHKNNLTTRLLKHPDRMADYSSLPNPLLGVAV
ncbi:MAG: iron transporter [Gammaproteobacteria bacterium]|nr:MAG: iron transporter [Gammaproteobacteria bacterium]